MTAGIRLLRAAERVAVPWNNGGGVTREVCRDSYASEPGSFDWRVSIAEVAQPGPFSRFASYQRLIALIAGRAMEVRSASNETVLLRPLEVHAFDGNDEVSGALPLGPVSDLNVIFQPAAIHATLRFSDRAEQWESNDDRTVILINVQPTPLACIAGGQPITLTSLDAVLAASGASLSRAAGGACAVVEIERTSAAH